MTCQRDTDGRSQKSVCVCFPCCQKIELMVLCCTSETTHDGQIVFRRDDGVSFELSTQHLYAYPTFEKALSAFLFESGVVRRELSRRRATFGRAHGAGPANV